MFACTVGGSLHVSDSDVMESHNFPLRYRYRNDAEVLHGMLQDGASPLYVASAKGHLAVVKELIENRADVLARINVSSARCPAARICECDGILRDTHLAETSRTN
jgi:hypothetical protein